MTNLAEEIRDLDRRILYISLIAIIIIGLLLNLTELQINSALAIYLIILIALSNIAYLYTKG